MSGYDDLLRQLRASVKERGDAVASGDDGGARLRRRFPRGRRGGLLVALVAVVVGGGVATAAQTGVLPVVGHDDHPLSAREVAARVVAETRDQAACRRMDPDKAAATTELVAPDPSVRRLLAGPGDAAAMRKALALNHGGPIVAGSARRVVFPSGSTVVLWVAMGDGLTTLADPAACGQARLAQLARDKPDPGSRLRQKAAAILATSRDTRPGLQTLWVMAHRVGANSTGGTGIPLGDGRPVPVGVVASGSGEYTGLAAPSATRVTLDGRDLHRSVPVRGGVFVITLHAGTGPVTLRQRAADGRVLARQLLRG